MTPWPHQTRGVNDTLAAIASGRRVVVLSSPTGGGKTWMIAELLRRHKLSGAALYTHRRLLIEQLSAALLEENVYHGVRAAGHDDERDYPIQLCSVQTEGSRVLRRGIWELHPSAIAVFDEGHLHNNETGRKLIAKHLEAGGAVVLVTATPFDLGDLAEVLIQAGTTSELRACGALVLAHHFGPDEPDWRSLRAVKEGKDPGPAEAEKLMNRPGMWGRIWEWFERLNPEHRPTICFGPSVGGSAWIADQFHRKGVRAAHLDANSIWIDGDWHKSTESLREEVLNESKKGLVRVLCNRFVLREGFDAPWLSHGILATAFGSLQSYLQAGGRLLRSYPGCETVTVQDHGGNWWRFGSLNEDRVYTLDDTDAYLVGSRADRMRQKKQREPRRCPRCARIIVGLLCNPAAGGCGFRYNPADKPMRPVVTEKGDLVELTGEIFRPRRKHAQANGPALWERMYYRSKTAKGERSFRQAAALFAQENNWGWPDPSWPFMPTCERDWYRLVADVPYESLVPKPPKPEAVPDTGGLFR